MKIYNPFLKTYVSKKEFRAYMKKEIEFYKNLANFGTACPREKKRHLERIFN